MSLRFACTLACAVLVAACGASAHAQTPLARTEPGGIGTPVSPRTHQATLTIAGTAIPLVGYAIEGIPGAYTDVPLTAQAPQGQTRWEMVGNPLGAPLSLSALGSCATGGALSSVVGQTWDAAVRSYVPTSALGDRLEPWQRMFVESGSATALAIPPSAQITAEARTAEARTAEARTAEARTAEARTVLPFRSPASRRPMPRSRRSTTPPSWSSAGTQTPGGIRATRRSWPSRRRTRRSRSSANVAEQSGSSRPSRGRPRLRSPSRWPSTPWASQTRSPCDGPS